MKIIVISEGGLANRIRPIFSAMALADFFGPELVDEVSVYWKKSTGCGLAYADAFDLSTVPREIKKLPSLPQNSKLLCRRGSIQRSVRGYMRLDIANLARRFGTVFVEDINRNFRSNARGLSGYECIIYFDSLPFLFDELTFQNYHGRLQNLKFSDLVESQATRFIKTLENQNALKGMHLRGTDFYISFDHYASEISRFPGASWVLGTDSIQLYEAAKSFLGDRLYSRDKSYPEFQQNRFFRSNKIVRAERDVIDALIDLRILATVGLEVFHRESTFAKLALEIHKGELTHKDWLEMGLAPIT